MTHELIDSREVHMTAEGTSISLHILSTWAEWSDNKAYDDNGDEFILPYIGEIYYTALDKRTLQCTDIAVSAAMSSNTHCDIRALYSSEGRDVDPKKVDEVKSWDEEVDVSTEIETIGPQDSYYDYNSATWKKWLDVWTAAPFSGTAETCPNMVIYKSKIAFRTTLYGSYLKLFKLTASVGRINDSQLLNWYYQTKLKDGTPTDIVSALDDTGWWLLDQVRSERISTDRYRYSMTFLCNPYGWNTIDENVNPVYKYRTFDARDLWSGFDLTESETTNLGQ